MTAVSTKDVNIYFSKTAGTPVVAAAPTGSAGSEATMAVTTGSGVALDALKIRGTGINSIDQACMAKSDFADAGSLELLGIDGGFATAKAPTTLQVFGENDWIKLCLSELSINSNDPNTVSVATYCNPQAVMESAVQEAGTFGFGGYMSTCDTDYPELYRLCADQSEVLILIDLGNVDTCKQGYLLAEGVCSSNMAWSLPLDGAIEYSGSVLLQNKFRHFWPTMAPIF